jgi:phage tail P2-like protein
MSEADDLLPFNATPAERALAGASRRTDAIAAPLADLWNPATCPAPQLPWLAWTLSVDDWEPGWPVSLKRATLAQAVEQHRRKGTLGAVRRAIELLGLTAEVVPWHQDPEEEMVPYTFRIDAFVENIIDDGFVFDETLDAAVRDAVDKVKSVRDHYSLRVGERFEASLGIAAATVQTQRHCLDLDPRPRRTLSDATLRVALGLVQSVRHCLTHVLGPEPEEPGPPPGAITVAPPVWLTAILFQRQRLFLIHQIPET